MPCYEIDGIQPVVDPTAYVHPSAVLIGDVIVGPRWDVGRTFFRDHEVYSFNLRPQPDHKRPGMINLQQYHLEELLVARAMAAGVEMRWKNKVISVDDSGSGVALEVETPDGRYAIDCDWLVVADGARSPSATCRGSMSRARSSPDRFLIADVLIQADFPAELQCRRMQTFRHGRLLFVGDAAHQGSPFGVRGANSGVQDIDNLAWKLALVLEGRTPETLLDTYSDERVFTADENILNSTRSTDFITAKSNVSRTFRNAVPQLAGHHAFARRLVNSGRLSVPSVYAESPLNTPDAVAFEGDMVPGEPLNDAPVKADGQPSWLLDQLGGTFQFVDLRRARCRLRPAPNGGTEVRDPSRSRPHFGRAGLRALHDVRGRFLERYDALPGSAWLLGPDQHIAARWRRAEAAAIRAALARATGR